MTVELELVEPTPEEVAKLTELGYSRAEMDILSPEERASFLDEDAGDATPSAKSDGYATPTEGKMPHEEAPLETKTGDEPEAGVTEDIDDESEEDDQKAASKEPATEAVVGEPDDEPDGDVEDPAAETQRDRRTFVPRMPAPEARDFDAELNAIDVKKQDLIKKWGGGDMSDEDYATETSRVDRETQQIIRAQTRAELAADFNTQAQTDLWTQQQEEFLEENPDYQPVKGKVNARFVLLDATVKQMATDSKYAHRSGAYVLREAKKAVEAEFGVAKGEPAPKPAAPARAKPDLRAVPKTLAHVPAASDDSNANPDDEFAHIDNLDGIDQERAIAALTPEKQDAYLRYSA